MRPGTRRKPPPPVPENFPRRTGRSRLIGSLKAAAACGRHTSRTHRVSAEADEWEIVGFGYGGKPATKTHQASEPFASAPVKHTPAADNLEPVLNSVGATLPTRDVVDARIVNDVRTGKGGINDSPRQVGDYPAMRAGTAPADSDDDGIPDEWETKHGLNPKASLGRRQGSRRRRLHKPRGIPALPQQAGRSGAIETEAIRELISSFKNRKTL